MFTPLLVLTIGASVALAQIPTSAATFIALGDNWGNFAFLQQCQKYCLTGTTQKYGTPGSAVASCQTLGDDLGDVDTCFQTAASGCKNNETAVQGAQAILAEFCSSVGLAYTVSVSSTSVPGETSGADAAIATTAATAAASSGETTPVIPGPTTPVASGTGSGVASTASPTATFSPTPSAGAATNTTSPIQAKGLSTSEKAGIGVGVGLGVPIIIGALAAWYFMNRRRKSRSTGGPYGPVLTNEKGATDSASYSSPQMEPHEMQPMNASMNSGAPFLPAIATRDLGQKQHQYEPAPAMTASHDQEYKDEPASTAMSGRSHSSPQQDQYYAAQERPATSRDVSRGGTPPPIDTQARPQTAPQHLAPVDDEPPSPISPVSPISPAGSRPASLRHSVERHD